MRTSLAHDLTVVARSPSKKARPAERVTVHLRGKARKAPPGGVLTDTDLRAHTARPKVIDTSGAGGRKQLQAALPP